MVQTSNIATRQEVEEECTSRADLEESVLFNSDSLFKIASYLPADGLLNLALTCRRLELEVMIVCLLLRKLHGGSSRYRN